MDEQIVPDMTLPEAADDEGEMPAAENPAIETASNEYLGRWNRLVSTTNWEKGRIVAEWREALIEAGAPVAAYTDEAWSRRVGSVTPQHTGRLRRVYQRFAAMREEYHGLYWSHFQAALDWDDAEMWLEGAVQNRWSISQMQGERSRTLGAWWKRAWRPRRSKSMKTPPPGYWPDLSAARAEFRPRWPKPARRPRRRLSTGGRFRGCRRRRAVRWMRPILTLATSRRRSGHSRTCPPCPPIFATPSTASSWRSSTIGSPTGRKSSRGGRAGHLGGLAAVGPGAGRGVGWANQ